MSSGFITPSDPVRAAAEDRRYLRTEGGALMRLGEIPGDHLMWVCGGCAAESVCAWPLDRPAATRYATRAEAWAGAEASALDHARACFELVSAAASTPRPAPPLTFEADPRLPAHREPLAGLIRDSAPNLAALVTAKTHRPMPPTRIVATTWYGMYRRHLAQALAISDLPARPRWTVRARFLLTALRTLPYLALTVPDYTGGVTILINAGFACSDSDMRATLLHELVHAVQLGDPAHRARAVRGLRIDTGVDQADPAWVRAANLLVDQDEAEATAAESWTWQQVKAEQAQEDAMLRAERAEQQERDRAEAACGRMRTACTWCDGEFYVPKDEPGPHSCPACDYKNGY